MCSSKKPHHEGILLLILLISAFDSPCLKLSAPYPSQKILLVFSDFTDDVEMAGKFAEVSTFHAEQCSPNLKLLASYDAVLVWSMAKFFNTTALGDVLADYWDAGGRVVLAQYSMINSGLFDIGGSISHLLVRFGSRESGYVFLDPVYRGYDCCKDNFSISSGVKTNPLLAGADTVGVPSIVNTAPINGGEVETSWSNGYPLLSSGQASHVARPASQSRGQAVRASRRTSTYTVTRSDSEACAASIRDSACCCLGDFRLARLGRRPGSARVA